MFKKAIRANSKLRLCFSGPSGSGKTTAALTIADAIKGDGRVAVIDTENGSASLYSDQFDFDVLDMAAPFSSQKYVDAIKAAEDAGYSVIVVDSASHEWDQYIEDSDNLGMSKYKGNTWAARSQTKPIHRRFINAMVQSKCHIICTARSKTETAQEGKRVLQLGTKLIQDNEFVYEFTVALDLSHNGHQAMVLKDRTRLFDQEVPQTITEKTGAILLKWLNSGASESDVVAGLIEDIEQCEGMLQLKEVFTSAYKMAMPYGDKAVAKITAAKDSRKSELEAQDDEPV